MGNLGNKEIMAANIKRLLAGRDMSAKDLSKQIQTPYTTVLSWINAVNYPRIDRIERMANFFGVRKSDLVEPPTTPRPSFLSPHIKDTMKTMTKLNEPGQSKVSEYARDILNSGIYNLNAETDFDIKDYVEAYTIGSAAAGDGFAYGDSIEDQRLFMTTTLPNHDFCVNVKGDSMFPTIMDGDVAFVVKNFYQNDGKIYVLDIDGETVVKRVYFEPDEITLVSDNEDWDDRIVTGIELQNTRILGEVIGWETPVK